MSSLHTLREALVAIHSALAEDALERLPPLVHTYHTHLHIWMAAGIRDADEPVRQLRQMHHEVIAAMQQRQQRLHAQMQAERRNACAARAYLSSSTA